MLASHASLALLPFVDQPDAVGLSDGLSLFALAALAWLFTYALHSTLMLGSAWIATRRLAAARAGLRERIWKFAVLAAFATSSVQVGMGFEPLGGRLSLQSAPALLAHTPAVAPRDATTVPEIAPIEFALAPSDSYLSALSFAKQLLGKLGSGSGSAGKSAHQAPAFAAGMDRGTDATPSGASSDEFDSAGATAGQSPWVAGLGDWTQWAFVTCALGAFGGLVLFALLWLRLNGCLRDRVALEHGSLAEKLRELCRRAGIRRRVRLSVAPSLGAPISMGMFRPEICVPPRVLLELSEEEQEALLAHELAHVVRRDPLWLATCRLCEGVFFFQPLNRVARHEIEDCAEFLSDAWAVRQTGLRFSLASCLTRIAEWIVGERRALPAPAMAHGRSRLRHRVELLLDESAADSVDQRPRWLGVACTGFCAALVAVVPCVSASDAALSSGDNAHLPFLPSRNALGDQPACDKLSEAPSASKESAKSEKIADVPSAADTPKPAQNDSSAELGSELDGLAQEIALLRNEVSTLDLDANFSRDVNHELGLLEMKLTHMRELNSRLELLRASLKSKPDSPPMATRAACSNTPTNPAPANHATTPSAKLEEISK